MCSGSNTGSGGSCPVNKSIISGVDMGGGGGKSGGPAAGGGPAAAGGGGGVRAAAAVRGGDGGGADAAGLRRSGGCADAVGGFPAAASARVYAAGAGHYRNDGGLCPASRCPASVPASVPPAAAAAAAAAAAGKLRQSLSAVLRSGRGARGQAVWLIYQGRLRPVFRSGAARAGSFDREDDIFVRQMVREREA
eukprot:SAG11_NODE_3732_length_2258_cov_1.641501_2_plen_193_part_00